MQPVRTTVAACTAVLLACPIFQAQAEPPPAQLSDAPAPTARAPDLVPEAASPGTSLFGGVAKAVPTTTLDNIRGGAEVTVNDMRLHGTVADNAAVNVRSGYNSIAEGAFSNAAGIPTAIQNSGSNVLIQNATIVNVQFK
ncbi:hypothetical protein [Cupriavidus numazuensis]|uniref:Periplasmic protein n=1 Tax=Cupriavidus numazuensis TaxID=221992 RepID=A0ABM8TF51_9BURK|nr:hypothetical protein [Cupriavidus numazuensis]CAG2141677.1 hypothetical protein LMG26411_02101 [Cupriavidus numazuensis]